MSTQGNGGTLPLPLLSIPRNDSCDKRICSNAWGGGNVFYVMPTWDVDNSLSHPKPIEPQPPASNSPIHVLHPLWLRGGCRQSCCGRLRHHHAVQSRSPGPRPSHRPVPRQALHADHGPSCLARCGHLLRQGQYGRGECLHPVRA
ncbi:hypothetical protein Naga_101475g2 [Nannochloropsis gaditana]|uniref:Uncharacterized protein n=1 Tax=Nannochloropsis gaditana TaxID=72520 RepID=W7THW1_9STRA|nr:hypothetical protein Naga_101475g2 [Nannochloropsis gaditana]